MQLPRLPVQRTVAVFVFLALAAPALAQPSLSNLWPVDVGRSWEFDVRIEGPPGTVQTGTFTLTVANQAQLPSGVTVSCFGLASTVAATAPAGTPEGLSALEQRLWRARPALRQKLSAEPARRITSQPSLLLAVPEACGFDNGFLVDDEVAMGIWSDSIAEWGWWWITDPTPGSTFRLQIRTQVADDAFVNGAVRTIDGAVTTPAGSFTDAVIVDYVVEMGESTIVDGGGNVIGTASFETAGWIAFVPGVGPVASEESFGPVQIDCPACPPGIFETITTTMDLRAATPVSAQEVSFGGLKARY